MEGWSFAFLIVGSLFLHFFECLSFVSLSQRESATLVLRRPTSSKIHVARNFRRTLR